MLLYVLGASPILSADLLLGHPLTLPERGRCAVNWTLYILYFMPDILGRAVVVVHHCMKRCNTKCLEAVISTLGTHRE